MTRLPNNCSSQEWLWIYWKKYPGLWEDIHDGKVYQNKFWLIFFDIVLIYVNLKDSNSTLNHKLLVVGSSPTLYVYT